MRCLALFTGGLDSLLAVRLMQAQGSEVVGLHVRLPICAAGFESAAAQAAALGIELRAADLGDAYAHLLRAPRFGRIDGVAPCTDCRIAMFAKARELMQDTGASFVVSGEVIGQRPKSAVRDLEVVAHHAGLADLLVRPLSAGLLPPAPPEARGWVDRSRLKSIQGKSRKDQLELARTLKITDVPPPRPDCQLLAEPLRSRVHDYLAGPRHSAAWLLPLLAIGRHVRLDDETQIILGRNQAENDALEQAARASGDRECTLAIPRGFAGPTALLVGPATSAAREETARLIREHGRPTGAASERIDFEPSVA